MYEMSSVHTMTFDGGDACFDFINSGYDRENGVITERLHSYQDLLILVERLALFDKNTMSHLKKLALGNQEDAEIALNTTRVIRAWLYQLFESVALQLTAKLDSNILKELNAVFAEALRHKLLSANGGQLKFTFNAAPAELMAPVWKFVLSAYELLNTGDVQHIRQCARCAWLFIDKTKNHRKKWCSMESCGNSQKTKRYYLKRKKQ